ncbi:MAG: hypothetical protein ACPGGB_10855, partial [Flavobacteriales bacterium]
SSGGSLGLRSLSSLQPDWVQGIEWRPAGVTVSAEWGRLRDGWSGKMTLSLPPIGIDSAPSTNRLGRKSRWPNRHLPALVPVQPFVEVMTLSSIDALWWGIGLQSPVTNSRKSH